MRAVVYHELGGPDLLQVQEVPAPEVGSRQMIVKVAGLGLNPIDFKVMRGVLGRFVPQFPAIPGYEYSGIVHQIGKEVTEFEVGQAVFGVGAGTMAEFALVSPEGAALAPASLDLPDAGTVPVVALTAYQTLFDVCKVQPGQRVLIHAAAGGVGTAAVQLARWKGAYVIGTGSASSEHYVRELGADEFIDYKKTSFEEVLKPVDAVIDTLGGETSIRSEKILKAGGYLASISSPPDVELFEKNGKHARFWSMQPDSSQLQIISNLIEDLKFRVVISGQFHFERAREAFEVLEGGHVRGKLLILP